MTEQVQGDAGTAAAATATATAGGENWFAEIPAELGHVAKANGWYKDGASRQDVLLGALKGYSEVQKVVGLDKVPLPPKGADGQRDWTKADQVWNALGRPEKPDGYSVFKAPQGGKLTDEQTALRDAVHAAGLSDWQVQKVAGVLQNLSQAREAKSQEAVDAEVAAASEALKAKWGQAYDQNTALANRAMSKASPELQEKITKSGLGRDPEFMALFSEFGQGLQEDGTVNAIAGNRGTGGGALTPDQAQREIDSIMQAATADPKHPYFNDKHPEHGAVNQRVIELYGMLPPRTKPKGQ